MNEVSGTKRRDICYQLESIKETDPPEGILEGNWYRCVIGQGTSKIICIRSGTLEEVTEHAEAYASDLSNRASKGSSPYAPRNPQNQTKGDVKK